MVELQTGSAATAGLSLVGRNLGSVAIWGVLLLLLFIVPAMIGLPTIIGAIRDPSTAENAGQALNGNVIYQVINVAFSLVGSIFLQAAVYRAVLRPEDRGFAYLRLSRDEALLFAWLLIALTATVIVLFVLGAGAGALSYLIGRSAGAAMTGITIVVVLLVMFPIGIWLGLRLVLVGPAIVATGRLDIAGAWALTKGRVGSLFVTAIINILLVLAIAIGIFLVLLLVAGAIAAFVAIAFGGASGGSGAGPTGAASIALAVALIVVGLIAFLLYFGILAALQAIGLAPWADVYKQLTHRDVAQTFA